MKNEAKLMRRKAITLWIKGVDRWIEDMRKRFSYMGSQDIDPDLTSYSEAEQWMLTHGAESWKRGEADTHTKFPWELSTAAGARAAIACVRGMRLAAAEEEQKLSDDISLAAQQSRASGSNGKAASNSEPGAAASKKGPAREKT